MSARYFTSFLHRHTVRNYVWICIRACNRTTRINHRSLSQSSFEHFRNLMKTQGRRKEHLLESDQSCTSCAEIMK
jgi:hypothetical protein